jgi:hypothetical protein
MVTNPEGDWEEVVVCFRRSYGARSGGATGVQAGDRAYL